MFLPRCGRVRSAITHGDQIRLRSRRKSCCHGQTPTGPADDRKTSGVPGLVDSDWTSDGGGSVATKWNLTVDCARPATLAAFWKVALG